MNRTILHTARATHPALDAHSNICSNIGMRWTGQSLSSEEPAALPGLALQGAFVRSVQTPEFAGITFHEVLAKSALNHVPGTSTKMPFAWTINPYRGCSHACVYCFARPTHTYLDFDSGKDFDQQIVVKVNVAEVLARELRSPPWVRSRSPEPKPSVALGTNTDPYQRAEGRYALMPSIIRALASSGTPFSILTKGSLLRRDLDLIVEASSAVPVSLAMSIAVYDDELQHSIEPGTPSTKARLATVSAVREAGLECQVFMMPILPLLTDTDEHLDYALSLIEAAGASGVVYSALHLKPGVKQWFMAWLGREHPELLPNYARLYATGMYASKEYRVWLAGRMKPLIRRHGLSRAPVSRATGGVAEPGSAPPAASPRAKPAFAPPQFMQTDLDEQPTLF
jgi:DNA repair photolyase